MSYLFKVNILMFATEQNMSFLMYIQNKEVSTEA